MADKTLYTESSIESLSPLEFTRLRPGVYAGDTTYSTQLLVEIFSNAVDEFRLGHGNEIDVIINTDGVITLRDYGQGFIPNSYRDDGKTILEAAFSVLNTSGKYREDGTYEGTSLGSFGIGSKITNYLSHWLNVCTYRDNKYEMVRFQEGEFFHRTTGDCKEPSGTTVSWLPSEEFFKNIEVNIKEVKTLFKTISCLCPGLKVTLSDKGEITEYFSKNGINDLVDDAVKDKEMIKNRFNIKWQEDKFKLDLVMTYTSNYAFTVIPYVNTGLTESGPHITQIKTALTREMNKFFREKKWIKEKEDNLTGEDIQEGLYIVFNMTAPSVSYDAQVKSRITSIETKPFISAFTEELNNWMERNEKEVKLIADKALLARKAREAAKKAREAIREPKDKKAKLINLPTKLVDAWSKDRLKCELLIAEGDSAAAGLIGARDSEFQAVFPIRGKILNVFKADTSKIFANQEIVNLIKAIGLEIDKKTNKPIYDKSKLRYGKIIMCCDADPDGEAIKNLLLTCFWWLCPELVVNGHIYAAVPPLFRITTRKNEYIYLRDATALEEYKKNHLNEKYAINRNKGLGEQDADELEECLLNPNTRNVKCVTVEDKDKAHKLFEILMGPSVPPRREYVLKYAEDARV